MTELVLRDMLGQEIIFKRIGDIGYQVTINGQVTQIAYIDCGQAENLQVFLAEQLGKNEFNEGIEAAAKFVDDIEFSRYRNDLGTELRKLKK